MESMRYRSLQIRSTLPFGKMNTSLSTFLPLGVRTAETVSYSSSRTVLVAVLSFLLLHMCLA
jgi:hypothetical protein